MKTFKDMMFDLIISVSVSVLVILVYNLTNTQITNETILFWLIFVGSSILLDKD